MLALMRPHAAFYALLALLITSCASPGPGRDVGKTRWIGAGPAMTRAAIGGGLHAEPAGLFLSGLDTDLDAVIAPQELSAASERLWTSADLDRDSQVSIHELNVWRERWFGAADGWPGQFHFDTDGNSSVDRKEFDLGLKAIYADFDADKNGRIERAELLAPSPGRREGKPAGARGAAPRDRDIRG